MNRTLAAALLALLLLAPAGISLGAQLIGGIGFMTPAELIEAGFARLGVTNSSPLPVRQAWYLGVYILAPGAGGALALAAATGASPSVRTWLWPLGALGLLLAGFWIVWSLANH